MLLLLKRFESWLARVFIWFFGVDPAVRKHVRVFCFKTVCLHQQKHNIMPTDLNGNGHVNNRTQTTKTPKRYLLHHVVKEHLDSVAAKLPGGPEEYNIENIVKGRDMLNKGVGEVKKGGLIVPVFPEKDYALPAVALRNINHVTKLRQFWMSGGLLGCVDYINRLGDYISYMKQLYPSLFSKDGTYLGVKEGTQLVPQTPTPGSTIFTPN